MSISLKDVIKRTLGLKAHCKVLGTIISVPVVLKRLSLIAGAMLCLASVASADEITEKDLRPGEIVLAKKLVRVCQDIQPELQSYLKERQILITSGGEIDWTREKEIISTLLEPMPDLDGHSYQSVIENLIWPFAVWKCGYHNALKLSYVYSNLR